MNLRNLTKEQRYLEIKRRAKVGEIQKAQDGINHWLAIHDIKSMDRDRLNKIMAILMNANGELWQLVEADW